MQHKAHFSWPSTHPSTVVVTGSFDNWSGSSFHLTKKAHGFEGSLDLGWDESFEYKYVVDGTWQVREDEDKEWDSAGNVNNVRRTPPAPATTASGSPSSPNASAALSGSDHHNHLLATQSPGPTSSIAAVKDVDDLAMTPPARREQLPTPSSGLTPAQAVVEEVKEVNTPVQPAHIDSTPTPTAIQPSTSNAHSHSQTSSFAATTPTAPVRQLLDEVAESSPDVVTQTGGTAQKVEEVVSAYVGSLGGLVHGMEGYLFGDRHPITEAITEKSPVEDAASQQVRGAQHIDVSNVPTADVSTTSATPHASGLNGSSPATASNFAPAAISTQQTSTHHQSSPQVAAVIPSNLDSSFTTTRSTTSSRTDSSNLAYLGLGAPILPTSSTTNSSLAAASENGTESGATTDFSRKVVDDASTTSHPDNFEVVPPPAVLADEPSVLVAKPSSTPIDRLEQLDKQSSSVTAPAPSSPTTTSHSARLEEAEAKLRKKPQNSNVRTGPIPGSGETIPESLNPFAKEKNERVEDAKTGKETEVGPSAGRTLAMKGVVPQDEAAKSAADKTKAVHASSPPAATAGTPPASHITPSQSSTALASSQISSAPTATPSTRVATTGLPNNGSTMTTSSSSAILTPSGSSTATFTPSSSVASTPFSSPAAGVKQHPRRDDAASSASTIGASPSAKEEKLKKRKSVLGKLGGLFGGRKDKS